jgi:hypothetical protein
MLRRAGFRPCPGAGVLREYELALAVIAPVEPTPLVQDAAPMVGSGVPRHCVSSGMPGSGDFGPGS